MSELVIEIPEGISPEWIRACVAKAIEDDAERKEGEARDRERRKLRDKLLGNRDDLDAWLVDNGITEPWVPVGTYDGRWHKFSNFGYGKHRGKRLGPYRFHHGGMENLRIMPWFFGTSDDRAPIRMISSRGKIRDHGWEWRVFVIERYIRRKKLTITSREEQRELALKLNDNLDLKYQKRENVLLNLCRVDDRMNADGTRNVIVRGKEASLTAEQIAYVKKLDAIIRATNDLDKRAEMLGLKRRTASPMKVAA